MPFLRRGGISLYFEMKDGHAPPVVLLHGWCCDHTYLAPQFVHFAESGHQVITMDFRGHGRSDKPEQDYPLDVLADDAAWICEALEVKKPVIIGHSMGGIVAYDIAARYPDLPAAIVMLDSAVVVPALSRSTAVSFLAKLRSPEYVKALKDFVTGAFFLATDNAERKAHILDAMALAPQYVMASAFEGLYIYNPEIGENIKASCLYIAASEPQPRSDMNRLRELLPKILYGQTVGSGHFCQLEVPEQVNAMIDRFLNLKSLGRQ